MDNAYQQFLPSSYTAYRTKIGLGTSPTNFLSEHSEIVLNWPYKDCILEGGQEKEATVRDEIFFNQVLVPDEITCLLGPKVFTNWQRHDRNGAHELGKLNPKDNLIIKGNNLLVLHSLKRCYAEKVKLIYIDVPFNTGKDIFNYNDSFSHSTWLTFMKNRLEVAMQLLAPDGTIFVHCDWHESHYLKVLLDEIFGREHLINEIIWCYTGPSSSTMKQLNRKHDTIFWYCKTPGEYTFNKDKIRIPYANPYQSMRKSLDDGSGWTKEDEQQMRERGRVPDDWWSDIAVPARAKIDGVKRTGYSTEKPYKLLDRIIAMASCPGDLVLDFFAGSGTTLYSAARAGRQYIGVEQLKGAYRLMVNRLESEFDFVTCELLNDAQNFVERIQEADTTNLGELFQEITHASFLSYRVDPNALSLEDFSQLSQPEQKQLLLDMIDTNALYVNYSEIDDPFYHVKDIDKKFNLAFYGQEKLSHEL